jgi:chorismate mutase-like protein
LPFIFHDVGDFLLFEKGFEVMTHDVPPELEGYRREIDECDRALVEILGRRFGVVRKVGEMKVREKMAAVQPARAQAVKDAAVRMGQDQGLDADFMCRLYEVMIDYAHDLEHEILDRAGKD